MVSSTFVISELNYIFQYLIHSLHSLTNGRNIFEKVAINERVSNKTSKYVYYSLTIILKMFYYS